MCSSAIKHERAPSLYWSMPIRVGSLARARANATIFVDVDGFDESGYVNGGEFVIVLSRSRHDVWGPQMLVLTPHCFGWVSAEVIMSLRAYDRIATGSEV